MELISEYKTPPEPEGFYFLVRPVVATFPGAKALAATGQGLFVFHW